MSLADTASGPHARGGIDRTPQTAINTVCIDVAPAIAQRVPPPHVFERFPDELCFRILTFLTYADIAAASRSCLEARAQASGDALWRFLLYRDFSLAFAPTARLLAHGGFGAAQSLQFWQKRPGDAPSRLTDASHASTWSARLQNEAHADWQFPVETPSLPSALAASPLIPPPTVAHAQYLSLIDSVSQRRAQKRAEYRKFERARDTHPYRILWMRMYDVFNVQIIHTVPPLLILVQFVLLAFWLDSYFPNSTLVQVLWPIFTVLAILLIGLVVQYVLHCGPRRCCGRWRWPSSLVAACESCSRRFGGQSSGGSHRSNSGVANDWEPWPPIDIGNHDDDNGYDSSDDDENERYWSRRSARANNISDADSRTWRSFCGDLCLCTRRARQQESSIHLISVGEAADANATYECECLVSSHWALRACRDRSHGMLPLLFNERLSKNVTAHALLLCAIALWLTTGILLVVKFNGPGVSAAAADLTYRVILIPAMLALISTCLVPCAALMRIGEERFLLIPWTCCMVPAMVCAGLLASKFGGGALSLVSAFLPLFILYGSILGLVVFITLGVWLALCVRRLAERCGYHCGCHDGNSLSALSRNFGVVCALATVVFGLLLLFLAFVCSHDRGDSGASTPAPYSWRVTIAPLAVLLAIIATLCACLNGAREFYYPGAPAPPNEVEPFAFASMSAWRGQQQQPPWRRRGREPRPLRQYRHDEDDGNEGLGGSDAEDDIFL